MKNLEKKIDHIVVVMLENRSFDHMLGFLYREEGNISPLGHKFDGLTGSEFNLDSKDQKHAISAIDPNDPYCYFYPKADPGEGFFNTNAQLYRHHRLKNNPGEAPMSGFVTNFSYTLSWEHNEHWNILPETKAADIMKVHTTKTLPVLSTLARSYAVSDAWFGSAPTETLPNRAFLHMATSQGRLTDKDKVYTAKSIFKSLGEKKLSWACYGYEAPPLSRHSVSDITHAANSHFGEFKDFKLACQNGSLPSYAFLEPSWGTHGNSQHPNYDVAKGEEFLLEIYQALRSSPQFEKTLLVITYDEHGGCYDHVSPPQNATAPDKLAGQFGFDFKRFGPRVPTVFVSPLIEAGTVIRSNDKSGVPFDHTSILKSIEKRFDLDPLTNRDKAAPDFWHVLTLENPRSDDPLKNVVAPSTTHRNDLGDGPTHLEEAHAEMLADSAASDIDGEGYFHKKPHLENSEQANKYIKKTYEDFCKKVVKD